jgi:hypothetical protein
MTTSNNPDRAAIYAQVMDDITGQIKSEAIRLAAQLRLPDLLKDGPRDLDDLAQASGTHRNALYRLMYALANCGYFEEVEPYVFAQTERSHILRSDLPRSLHGFAILHGEKWQIQPWREAMYTMQTGKPVFAQMFGKDLWHYFAEDDPQAWERFNQAMSSLSRQFDLAIAHSYDFSSYRTVIDVGGGQGSLLEAVLQVHPSVSGILVDQAEVIELARQRHFADKFGERVRLVSGNFFEAVPPGGDLYFLKQIIHDWDDAECIQILSHCREAMNPGGRVLVAEEVIVPGKKIPSMAALIDLQLQFLSPGGKRSEAEHRALFESSGLRLKQVWPTGSDYSILEAVAP